MSLSAGLVRRGVGLLRESTRVQPRALFFFAEPNARGPPRAALSILSRALFVWNLQGTERSGTAARSPEHSLSELGSFDRRGTRVLGGERTPPRALSSRYLDSVDHRGTGVLGDH